ncbi:hypothetical protein BHE74_00001762 [Ensete ventricosum]|nr:hypothetical protein GW17_00024105 [Ensete ventricosum]RWW89300.1 hypothetical protein BHE74_00001762 [Ensete ventricosum]
MGYGHKEEEETSASLGLGKQPKDPKAEPSIHRTLSLVLWAGLRDMCEEVVHQEWLNLQAKKFGLGAERSLY